MADENEELKFDNEDLRAEIAIEERLNGALREENAAAVAYTKKLEEQVRGLKNDVEGLRKRVRGLEGELEGERRERKEEAEKRRVERRKMEALWVRDGISFVCIICVSSKSFGLRGPRETICTFLGCTIDGIEIGLHLFRLMVLILSLSSLRSLRGEIICTFVAGKALARQCLNSAGLYDSQMTLIGKHLKQI